MELAGLMTCHHCFCKLKVTKLATHLLKCDGYKAEIRRLQIQANMKDASVWPNALRKFNNLKI